MQNRPNPFGYSVSTDRNLLNHYWITETIQGSYWGSWQTKAQILRAIEASVCFGVYERCGGAQVGFARVVSDHASFSSITDVFITEKLRGIGLGRMLMEEVIKHPAIAPTICILGTRDAPGFYEKFGFARIPESVATVMGRDPT